MDVIIIVMDEAFNDFRYHMTMVFFVFPENKKKKKIRNIQMKMP